jgi:hypothetical protein
MKTPAEAKSLLCPFARSFIIAGGTTLADAGCRGPECALWRWERITTSHPLWKPAVQKRATETGEKVPYAQASKWVAENLADLGMVPTRGYCGAGGAP